MKAHPHTVKRSFETPVIGVEGHQGRYQSVARWLGDHCTCPMTTWIDANWAAGGPGWEEHL